MKSKKATKRALLTSAMSLVLCFAMLLGSTYAWFTDEATTAVNTIQSGTLDVDLVDTADATLVGQKLQFVVNGNTGAPVNDDDILWEPGATFVSEGFRIVNLGNLWLKYQLVINGIDGDAKLLEAIDIYITDDPTSRNAVELGSYLGDLAPEGEGKDKSDVYYLVASMKEDAGNEYQGLTIEGVSVTVYATQKDAESDSFGKDYDKDAGYNYGKTNVGPYKLNVLSDGIATYDEETKTYSIAVNTVAQGGYNADQGGKFFAGYTVNVAGYGEGATVKFYKNGTEVAWTLADEERDGFINKGVHQQWTSVGTERAYRYDIDGDGVTDFTVVNDASNAGVEAAKAEELKKVLEAGSAAVLTEDIELTDGIVVSEDKTVKIDLNGHDISYAVSNSEAAAIISNKGTLELTGEGTISFVAANPDLNAIPAYATNTITNTGTLTIGEGVVITNGSEGGASYAVDNHGTFIMNGGELVGNRCALRVAKYNQDNVKFVMNGGTITAQTPAWVQLPGSDSNVAPTITVEINGGTMQSTKDTSADNDVMYTYSFGNSHANTTITIKGGEFLGGTVSIGAGYKGNVPTLAISGGTFEYDVMQWLENDGSQVLYTANK